MRQFTWRSLLVLLLVMSVAPAVFLGRIWKANADRGGQQPAQPFRIAGNFYPPARVDHRFKDGDTIQVGPIALTAHVTGGGTRGCTSWSFAVRDGDRVLNVVSACSLQVVQGMRYPEQRADIQRSLRVLRSLPADIWLTSRGRPWAGTASSSHARRRTTRWTRSSIGRATALSSTPLRRNSARGVVH